MANLGSNLVMLEICRKIFSYVPGEKSGLLLKNIILVSELAGEGYVVYFCFDLRKCCFSHRILSDSNPLIHVLKFRGNEN